MNEFTRPAEKLTGTVKEYVDLKADEIKLRTAKGLSIALNQVLSILAVLSLAGVVLLALAFCLILLLGQLVGSYALGALIIAVIFGVAAYLLYRKKDKLFLDSFVKLFVSLFFEEELKDEEEQARARESVPESEVVQDAQETS